MVLIVSLLLHEFNLRLQKIIFYNKKINPLRQCLSIDASLNSGTIPGAYPCRTAATSYISENSSAARYTGHLRIAFKKCHNKNREKNEFYLHEILF